MSSYLAIKASVLSSRMFEILRETWKRHSEGMCCCNSVVVMGPSLMGYPGHPVVCNVLQECMVVVYT